MRSIAASAIDLGSSLVKDSVIDAREAWPDVTTRSRMRKRLRYLSDGGFVAQVDRFHFKVINPTVNPARCPKCSRMRYISSNGINCAYCRDGIHPLALNGINKREMVDLGAIQID